MSRWTDDLVERLKHLRAKNLSAAEIARKLGGGISRNMVIGKLQRLGIEWSGLLHNKGHHPSTSRKRQPEKPIQPLLLPEPLPIGPSHDFPLHDMCKWIHGDPRNDADWRFCGHPVFQKTPYCEAHAARVKQPTK